jgi:hypothetical protein
LVAEEWHDDGGAPELKADGCGASAWQLAFSIGRLYMG